MKTYSKKTSKTKTKISIRPWCSYCRSVRWRFYSCSDDRGQYLAIACGGCEAQGPAIRPPIGYDSHADITNEMRREAADAWSSVWDQIASPPAWEVFYLDEDGCKVDAQKTARRRRRAAVVAKPATVSQEHQVHHVAPLQATNGHHQNGSSL